MDRLELEDRRDNARSFLTPNKSLPNKAQWAEYCEEKIISSPFGPLSVIIQGKKGLTPILTLHDLGMNGPSQFFNFFEHDEMRKIMEHFCAYHITAPGQQEGAKTIASSAKYPNVDEMADIVDYVVDNLKLMRVIGFGVGVGAHVMAKTALFYPNKFIALVAINCVCTPCGWGEWANAKLTAFHLRNGVLTQNVLNTLITHHLGYESSNSRTDLVNILTNYFKTYLNPVNFVRLLEMYTGRSQLSIERNEEDSHDYPNFSCSVMNVTSDSSPYLDDAVEFNGRLDPSNSTFIKLAECGGLILEEQPVRFTEAFLYFLQGMGYVCNLSVSANALASRTHQKIISERLTKARSKTMCMSQLRAGMHLEDVQPVQPKEV
ncbi:hypothetical protein ACOME3_003220 [Neoechinorhynchus agilis]